MKGELVRTKQQVEKLYTSSEKIKEQISVQRPSYDKTGLGFFLGQSTKKSIERKEPDTLEVKKDLRKIDDTSKDKENVTHSEKAKESNQDEVNKRKESHPWCDELEHVGDDCKGKSFKPISKFYCHNFHEYGHYVVDFKKPKFDSNNENSRMFRNTNHVGNN